MVSPALPQWQHRLRPGGGHSICSTVAGAENAFQQVQAQIVQQLQGQAQALQQVLQQLQGQAQALQQLQGQVQQLQGQVQQVQHRTSSLRLVALLHNSAATLPHVALVPVPHPDTGADPPDSFPDTVQGEWASVGATSSPATACTQRWCCSLGP